MDPLNPMVPIRPPAPVPPDYTRIRRVEPEQQRDADPDWQGAEEQTSEEQTDRSAEEDAYDPDWQEPTEAVAYTADGVLHPHSEFGSHPERSPLERWDPRRDGERRGRGRRPTEPNRPDDPPPMAHTDDPPPTAHIDISA